MAKLVGKLPVIKGSRNPEYDAARALARSHPGEWVMVESRAKSVYGLFRSQGFEVRSLGGVFYIRLAVAAESSSRPRLKEVQ
jgi:hypothetical protein